MTRIEHRRTASNPIGGSLELREELAWVEDLPAPVIFRGVLITVPIPQPVLATRHEPGELPAHPALRRRPSGRRGDAWRAFHRPGGGGSRAGAAGSMGSQDAPREPDGEDVESDGAIAVLALRKMLGDMSSHEPADEGSSRHDAEATPRGMDPLAAGAMPVRNDFADLKPPTELASALAGWRRRVWLDGGESMDTTAAALMRFNELVLTQPMELPALTLAQCAEILEGCTGLALRPGVGVAEEPGAQRILNLLLPLWLLNLGRPRSPTERTRAAQRLQVLHGTA